MEDLKGKSVIITGGTRGIGREIVFAFSRLGANVVFTYVTSKDKADSLVAEIAVLGAKALAIQADVRVYDQCRGVIEQAIKEFGHLDVLVNNAGIVRDKALMMMTQDDWKDVIDTDLGGVFNMSRAAITTFLKAKSGCIINISSVAGLVGIPRQTNYCAAKAGIIGFTKALAKEVAAYNVRVNAICPGYIETEMVTGMREDVLKNIKNSIPIKQLGKPQDIAEMCAFLASDKAKYIIGEAIRIDGGLAS